MKAAYIILAHKNPKQVARMISRLNTKNTSFHIHVDSSKDITKFEEEISKINQFQNIFFTENRYRPKWGGFNAIKAEVELLKAAVKATPDAILFISGQDYPIKSNRFLEEYLLQYKDKVLFQYQEVDLSKPNTTDHYYFADYFDYKKDSFDYKKVSIIARIMTKLLSKRTYLQNTTPYTGRVQFVMPADVAEYVIKEFEQNKTFNNHYKYTLMVDEQYFHTMLLNSKYKDRVVNTQTHYADYDAPHPVVWTSKDLAELAQQEALFARKFDTDIDETILDLIDEHILSK